MEKEKKYMIIAGSIYGVGAIVLCLLKFYAGLIILIPGAVSTYFKLKK
ncbi:MAG: hypothetical protein ACI39Q_03785 [Wujia sp.]